MYSKCSFAGSKPVIQKKKITDVHSYYLKLCSDNCFPFSLVLIKGPKKFQFGFVRPQGSSLQPSKLNSGPYRMVAFADISCTFYFFGFVDTNGTASQQVFLEEIQSHCSDIHYTVLSSSDSNSSTQLQLSLS